MLCHHGNVGSPKTTFVILMEKNVARRNHED